MTNENLDKENEFAHSNEREISMKNEAWAGDDGAFNFENGTEKARKTFFSFAINSISSRVKLCGEKFNGKSSFKISSIHSFLLIFVVI